MDPKELSEWWRTLDDPVHSRLLEQVVFGNLDLKAAWLDPIQALRYE